MTYQEQIKNPVGKLYWKQRTVQYVKQNPSNLRFEIIIRIPYKLNFPYYFDKTTLLDRLKIAVLTKAMEWDTQKNYNLLQRSTMSVALSEHFLDCCLLIIDTDNDSTYQYFKWLQGVNTKI